jgi:putative membrane protein
MKTLLLSCIGVALWVSPAWADEMSTDTTLNDAQIVRVAITAQEIDVERGALASERTKNESVRAFAEDMVKDHSADKKELEELATRLGIKPMKSAITHGLKEGARDTMTALKKLHRAAFDTAYLDAEVAGHRAVIDEVNDVLLPAVQSEDVKQALQDVLPQLKKHLEHARRLQKELAESASN